MASDHFANFTGHNPFYQELKIRFLSAYFESNTVLQTEKAILLGA